MKKDHLIKLGFSSKEADIFLALIQLGPSAVSTLARITKVKRTSVYDLLNSLMEKSLVASFKQGNTQFFYVDDLNKLILEEKKKLELSKNLVTLLRQEQGNYSSMQVHYYKGKEAYKQLYDDILKSKPKELLGWMHLDDFYKHLDQNYEDRWTEQRIQQGIHVKLILNESNLTRNFQKLDSISNRETRFIPKSQKFTTTCFLYRDFITFLDPNGEIIGIRIHSPELSKMHKAIFQMNWEALP